MASRKSSDASAPKTEIASIVPAGPSLELPAGSINTQLSIDHVADVVYTNLKRRLRADLEVQLDEARDLDDQLGELRNQLKAELENLRTATLELASECPEAVKARLAADVITAFNGKPCDVTVSVEASDETSARKGIGCTAFVTLVIDKRSISYGKSGAHEETVHTTWPTTQSVKDLIAQIEERLARKAAVARMAAAIRSQHDRPDLSQECKTLVIEQVMQRNDDTSVWLTALYDKLGLVIDNRVVREQLKLLAG